VPTVGRVEPVDRLFRSLAAQTFADFEVILVDQNEDDRLATTLMAYEGSFPIRVFRQGAGLSKARNRGIRESTGEILAFPDDDCWYPPRLLETIDKTLEARSELAGVTGRAMDEDGTLVGSAHWDSDGGWIERTNVWRRGCSITIFLRRATVEMTGFFDEATGAGSGTAYGAGEETDYLLRAIEKGARILYDPTIVVHHEQAVATFDKRAAERAFRYGMGIGRVLRKHRFPLPSVGHQLIRSAGGAVLSTLTGRLDKARFYRSAFLGKLRGWASSGGSK
jgi:glycosyltransferase involved in cell wall biosynthesis